MNEQPVKQVEETDAHTLASIVREIRGGVVNMIRSDVDLAKLEIKEAGGHLKRDVTQIAIFGVVAALGVFPLMAFFVIGLGSLLGGMYWLSALIVALVFLGVGGGLAMRAVADLRKRDLGMPHTRRTLELEIATLEKKVQSLADVNRKHGEQNRRVA
jgi:uncharacterized membrane protein YqjE